MKIILCSARDSVRERWRSILQGENYSIYTASSPQMLETVVHKNEQYLLLVHSPFMDVQTIATLSSRRDVYKVFVLSDTPGRKEGITLLHRGVVAYANTYISEVRLKEAVKTVMTGRVWFNQEIMAEFIHSVQASGSEAVHSGEGNNLLNLLTEREKEIARLVAQGFSNKAIGEQLYVSERTVKSHLSSIFAKTGVQSRLKLALLLNA